MESQIVFKIIISLIITSLIYCFIPVILVLTHGHYNEKESKKISTINSIIVFIVLTIAYIILNINQIANVLACMLYGLVNYYILKKSKKELRIEKQNEPGDEDLSELLKTLK